MNDIREFLSLDFQTVILGVLITLIVIKYVVTLIEWFLQKGGIEFKYKREKAQDKELLLDISKRVNKIEEESLNTASELQKISERTDSMYDKLNTMDDKIGRATVAAREALASKINEKYKGYIEMSGIPDDEIDEFVELHKAYNGVGGNHSGDAKFEYCISHLPILPVEGGISTN